MDRTEELLAELSAGDDADLSGFSIIDMVRAQHYCRQEYEKHSKIASDWQKLYDHLSIRVVPTRMEDEGIDVIKINGIGRVNLRPDVWTKTLDPQRLKEWLEENGLGDIIVPSVNGSTLKALIKEQMAKKDGKVVPEDVVAVTPYTRAVITKA